MLVDLHNHTGWGSGDSHLEPSDLIEQGRRWGLDGIAITDHEQVWDPEKVEMLRRRHGFPLIPGVEVETDTGHMLVFGLSGPRRFARSPSVEELRASADEEEAIIILAHPFDDLFSASQLRLNDDEAWERLIETRRWRLVDAVQTCNGRLMPPQRDLAVELARRLRVPTTGGSDTHRAMEVARCFTVFEDEIGDERDLVAAVKAGRCRASDWTSEGLPNKRARELNSSPVSQRNVPGE